MQKKKVVIVGGGFGGLSAAKKLVKGDFSVTLIDKRNYHLFQPLLYQVAMASLSPAEIAYPLRALIGSHPNAEVLLGKVIEINKEEKWVRTETNKVPFDYLILACGSTYTYFGSDQWEAFAPGLKTIPQATEIRRRVFLALEQAERETDVLKKQAYLTFVVVGGGPTGVELAGSLGEITNFNIQRQFHRIRPDEVKILLVEAGDRVLPSMTENLSKEALKQLNELSVKVLLNSRVTTINESGIQIGEDFIPSTTILWAAGVAANPLNKTLDTELDRQGRVIVTRTLSLPKHEDIFVLGDQAHYEWGSPGQALPGLAPVAMQQGRFVAKLIKLKSQGKSLPMRFIYNDKGQMATIGRSRAVAMYKGMELTGFMAWVGWLLIHIYYLIGFRNRLVVLFQWAWIYVTFRRGASLIIEKD